MIKVCVISVLCLAFAATMPCHAAEKRSDITVLLEEARIDIANGEKERAISALDLAFDLANAEGDIEALMKIGDLYLAADQSLQEKAMNAWCAAGSWKCR